MSDRVLGHVRRSRDECPCHPSVAVVMHDEEWSDAVTRAFCDAITLGIDPPEITEAQARASLPAHRPTNRDWFKINGGDHARV